ncbi:YkgJ family cysteine cluster protein [Geobacter sp.]|uniref:YkgJ family cysteine cluster protein n=1 Tax=Geobacter sp. TaxID=46610 RepID=UPI0027BAC342|nr:YkgJ family cysteine cluster protein [Geobacter sp.]
MGASESVIPFDFAAYDVEIADLAAQGLVKGSGKEGVRTVMARVAGHAEEVLAARLSVEEQGLIACGPGCAACCTVNVTVLLPEAIAIAAHLEEVCGSAELELVKIRTAEAAARVRWMDEEERIRAGVVCPFLDGRGWCAIHPVRPLTCRALSSTDPEQCRRALASQGSDEEETIVVNIFQKFLMEETFRGLSAALEKAGLDVTGRELARSVTRCFCDPRLADDFLAGKRIVFPE